MMTTTPPPPVVTITTPVTVTILGLGSLLSERSSRTTFPALTNFRLGRVSNKYRRVFSHPASIFFQRGLVANIETKEFSSLSAEEIIQSEESEFESESEGEGSASSLYRGGFICSVFEVPREEIFLNEVDEEEEIEEDSDGNKPKPTGEFLEREEEFDIVQVEFVELNNNNAGADDNDNNGSSSSTTNTAVTNTNTTGVLCTRFTDEGYIKRWGMERFNKHYIQYGIHTIWGYSKESGIRPCRVYLRHCYLAAKSMGPLLPPCTGECPRG